MHTQLILPWPQDQWCRGIDFDLHAKKAFLDFVAVWGIVFHEDRFFSYDS